MSSREMPGRTAFHARFAGLDWSGDVPFPDFDSTSAAAPDAIRVIRREVSRIGPPLKTIGRASIAANGVHFASDDEVSFDCEQGQTIGWVPGPAWRGVLPVSFYSSVVAITLAMRGVLPLHASSVVLDGKAWLLAGPSGAGKSTLTAELVAAGAQLLADDLTPVTLAPEPLAWRGRPAMRLHPASCAGLASDSAPEPTSDGRGKLLVRPSRRACDQGWPVGGVVLLRGGIGGTIGPAQRAAAFGSILFRPRILTGLAQRAAIHASLLSLANSVPMTVLPPVNGFDPTAKAARSALVLAAIAQLSGAAAKA